jgi:hypothetical protein
MAIVELGLETGRKIWASTLHMESTYAGLLEGDPFAAMNDRGAHASNTIRASGTPSFLLDSCQVQFRVAQ